jgi:regulatory protein
MTVVSIKSGSDADLQRIELSDGSLFSFKSYYLPPVFYNDSGYVPGTEISTDEADAFRFAAACLRAEKAALGLVARAEQCVFGLSRKLEKGGHSVACVRAVLARLLELEIVDDHRFARLWLQSRLNHRADTPRKLLAGLCGRGIDRDVADKALKSALYFEAEKALLSRYIVKNRLLAPQPSPKDEGSLLEGESRAADISSLKFRLKQEGFSSSLIQQFREEYDF